MKLNLPILHLLENSQNILIAGGGGGFDVYSGLPVYFALREEGKNVHLANYSFSEFRLTSIVSDVETVIDGLLIGAKGNVQHPLNYLPEAYLAQWFKQVCEDDVTVWMLPNTGGRPLAKAYRTLVDKLKVDAIILVDGGVDSLMRGDESGAGTIVEDSLSLSAVRTLDDVPVKIQACLGFGTEVEENVCHALALENMAMLAKMGAFLGACALTPQMPVFQQFESACKYAWSQPDAARSHIATRTIPAVRGEFGRYQMYPEDTWMMPSFLSPLMALYWFYDATILMQHNRILDLVADTDEKEQAFRKVWHFTQRTGLRQRRDIPY
jgi:hypothetical protein